MTMEILAESITETNHSLLKAVDNNTTSSGKPNSAICYGCNCPILDNYIMKVLPDLDWHSSCLKCAACNTFLDETCTCYLRDGKIYCKQDYNRLFVVRCSKCHVLFNGSDLVMKAAKNMYHIDCFRCVACSRQLMPGDNFALRDNGLFCLEDNEILDRNSLNTDSLTHQHNRINNNNKGEKRNSNDNGVGKVKRAKDGKPTRVRTVLSEKQLHTLRTCYGANPRPDALMKEQLVEMTGLSPRVIRVWFQNKRCKDKKKSMLLKHMQQQEKNIPTSMQGVPMVAQSPLRHENGLQAIESYHHQTWKRIPDFDSLHHDEINHNSFPPLMGSLYCNDDSAVYLGEEEYMDCAQPDSVSSQFSGNSTSPHSSG